MITQTIFPLLLFLLPLAYSPGPGNAFFALSGAKHGLKKTTPALLGYHAATFIVTFALGSGLSFSLLTSPTVAFGLSTLSAAYMFWLAWGCFQAARVVGNSTTMESSNNFPPGFWAGVLVLVLNPKAYSIIFLMFATFLRPGGGTADVVWITTLFTLNNLIAFIVWAIAGQILAVWLSGKIANFTYAFSFVGVGLWILYVQFLS